VKWMNTGLVDPLVYLTGSDIRAKVDLGPDGKP